MGGLSFAQQRVGDQVVQFIGGRDITPQVPGCVIGIELPVALGNAEPGSEDQRVAIEGSVQVANVDTDIVGAESGALTLVVTGQRQRDDPGRKRNLFRAGIGP